MGGGGAVGLSAIQIAVGAGCHVTTTCGKQSIDRVLEAGAEQAVDYVDEVRSCWIFFCIIFRVINSDISIMTADAIQVFFFEIKFHETENDWIPMVTVFI